MLTLVDRCMTTLPLMVQYLAFKQFFLPVLPSPPFPACLAFLWRPARLWSLSHLCPSRPPPSPTIVAINVFVWAAGNWASRSPIGVFRLLISCHYYTYQAMIFHTWLKKKDRSYILIFFFYSNNLYEWFALFHGVSWQVISRPPLPDDYNEQKTTRYPSICM